MKAFKCPKCKMETRSMLEVTSNVMEYGQVYIQEEEQGKGFNILGDKDIQSNYDDSIVTYECIQCGYTIPDIESCEELEEYLEAQV